MSFTVLDSFRVWIFFFIITIIPTTTDQMCKEKKGGKKLLLVTNPQSIAAERLSSRRFCAALDSPLWFPGSYF